MIKYDNILFKFLILILPLTLITGSAIPDITISITGIYNTCPVSRQMGKKGL